MKPFIYLITSILMFSCQGRGKAPESTNSRKQSHSITVESSPEAEFLKYDRNSDAPYTSIKRPEHSFVKTKLDTTLLYNIWTTDPNGPAADFVISNKSFYLADYDGDGDMPFLLLGTKLSIFYEHYIEDGEITFLKKDTLKIRWKGIDTDITYVTWPVD
ncbi:hypothetical protein ACLI09_17710 [Flavobacterium sp. RHBU_24]|uniref:hypothetical protein n=1 Tax=Flavobacterium sp. RHBU_24 TaxID=3391185 RepID=UPI00398508FE